MLLATPVSTHFKLGLRALEAGKHLFVEKPLAASSEEAQDLIAAADERGLVLMPGHTFLYSPPVDAVRNLITSGELGEIYFVSTSRVNLGLHQTDVSVAWDLGPHDFSILRYWLEEAPTNVTAMARGCVMPDSPDVAFINLQFPSGTIANVEISWLAPSKLRRTTVVGSQKMVVYDDTSNEPVRVFDSGVNLRNPESFGEYRLTYRTGDIVSPHIAPLEPLFLELQDFATSIRDGGTPRSTRPARARRRPHDRGGRRVARARRRARHHSCVGCPNAGVGGAERFPHAIPGFSTAASTGLEQLIADGWGVYST